MKLNPQFVPYQAEDTHILVPLGGQEFSGIVRSNPTAAFIVENLKNEITREDLIDRMQMHYGIDRQTAERDVEKVLETLRQVGALDE